MKKLFKSTNIQIFILMFFCVLLWIIRVQLTNSLFYGFLIWNLFLAYIPFLISSILNKKAKILSKYKLILILFIWLLFLPNAPYIITDFIHLNEVKPTLIWLDIFLLFSFSLTGLLIAVLSLSDIHKIIKQKWNSKIATYFLISTTFLCGFGIYLGRFLRFNSWDVFTSPLIVLKRSVLSINDPKTWFITLSFGSFLYILFLLSKSLKNN